MVTVFEINENSIWFKNCHHDHIPFSVKGNGNIVFSVRGQGRGGIDSTLFVALHQSEQWRAGNVGGRYLLYLGA